MTPPRDVTFDDLYAYRAWVRGLAVRLADDDAGARDLEQQVWVTALERPPRSAASLRGWLGTVTRNAARNLRRAGGRRERHELAAGPGRDARSPDELAAEAEAQQVLVRAVLDLDEPYRGTVLLRWFDGLTPTDVAARQGVPVATVHTRLARAHEQLRERLDRKFGGRDAWVAVLVRPFVPDATPSSATGTAAAAAGSGVMAATIVKMSIGGAAVLLALLAFRWYADDTGTAGAGTSVAAASEDGAGASRKDAPKRRHPSVPDVPGHGTALDAANRESDLAGIVVDPAGAPVPGAELAAVSYPWQRVGVPQEEAAFLAKDAAKTTSAADGTFALRLRSGESVNVRVRAPGLATTEFVLFAAGERARLTLPRAVALEVTFTHTRGGSVEGRRLVAITWPVDADTRVFREGRSDASGRVVFDDLPPGVKLHLHPDGWTEGATVTLPETGKATMTLPLGRGRAIDGVAVDAATGRGIEGARITVGTSLLGEVVTDAEGRFHWEEWLGHGNDGLHCTARGYAKTVIVPGDAERLTFQMKPAIRVTGRLVGGNATPVAGAFVTASASGGSSSARAVSGDDGRFVLEDLGGDSAHRIVVSAPGYARLERTAEPPVPAANVDLGDVALGPPRTIAGAVLVDGQAFARAVVTLQRRGDPGEPAQRETRRSDDQGRFRFDGLAPGTYAISAFGAGLAASDRTVELPADRDVMDLVLGSGGGETRRLTVLVVDGDDRPIADAPVVIGGIKASLLAKTGADGVARFDVPRRKVTVIVNSVPDTVKPWLFPSPESYREIDAVATEVTLRLRAGAWIDGVLFDADGRPVAQGFVSAEGGPPWRNATTDRDGRFRFAVPAEGTFTVRWSGQWQDPSTRAAPIVDSRQQAVVENVAPGTQGVELRATRIAEGLEIRVRVVTPDGDPVAGDIVTAKDIALANEYAKSKTDAEGRAVLSPVPGRTHSLFAGSHGGFLWTGGKSVQPGGPETTLVLRRAATITGIIVDAEGRPVSTYKRGDRVLPITPWVQSEPAGWPGESTNAGADGRFTVRVPSDEPGPWTIEFNFPPDGDVQMCSKVEGVRAGATDVRLVLRPVELK